MFKQTYLASAVLLALSSPAVFAAENDATQGQQAADDMEVIEVVGIRSSLNKAVNLKRQNVQVVDAIVAEDIGKFPDNNVVEALQRVTGVQVTDRASGEVNTVTIRGLTDVTTTVNGRQIFTAAGRQVAVADIPASLLESVEVFKTRSASQLESGIAGQIDIRTHRPFNFEGGKVSVAARGVYQDQADKTDPSISALLSNRWDTSIGEVGALINLSYTRTNFRDQNVTPGAVVPFVAEAGYGFGTQYERMFSGWPQGLENGLPNQAGSTLDLTDGDGNVYQAGVPYILSRDAIFQNDLRGERERPAFNVSLQWAPNDWSEYLFEAFYNGYRNETFNSMLFSYVDWWGDVDYNAPMEFYEGTNVVKSRIVGSPALWSSGDFTKASTDSYVFALGGKWDISPELQLKSELVYQTSKYKTEFVAMRADAIGVSNVKVDFNDHDGLPLWQFVEDDYSTQVDLNAVGWNYGTMYDNAGEDRGDSIQFTLDADYYLDLGIFTKAKFGLRYENRSADTKSRGADAALATPTAMDDDIRYYNPSFFDGEADVPQTWTVANGHYLHANRDYYRELYGISTDAAFKLDMRKTFDITEKSYALYAQSDYETELFGKRVDGQIGLRYSHAATDFDFWTYNGATLGDVDTDSDSNSSSKFLPNFVGRLWLTDDLVARFAYTETLRRPEFGQLNPYTTWTKDLTGNQRGTAGSGNPNLKPVESKNYDVSLEYYFGKGSSVYGTWFRRDIEGLVYDSLSLVTHQQPGETETYEYVLSQPGNASNGTLEGYEVGAIYFPEGLPSLLDGLGAQISGTFLDSSQDIPQYNSETGDLTGFVTRDMFGVSDSSYSAVLIYDKEIFSARLSYVWRDDWLNNYEAALFANPRGVYRTPEKSLDFQFSYNVTEDLVVTFDATNLTGEIYHSYYQDEDIYNFGNSLYSRTFALGIRYSM